MPAAVSPFDRDSSRPPRHLVIATLVAFAITLATLLLATSTATAEEIFTSQAAAANATDSTWIPAPPKRAALCLVDTGVDHNPDTTNVIARYSVDGGDPGDLSPDHHGTLMAMIASAPYNGFGMVGAAPSINIVSVRASRDGRTFGGTDLTSAVQICINKRTAYNIKTVSLSLGGALVVHLDASAMAAVEDTVESARRVDLNVVAAAGNHEGPVDWPAGYEPVLAVGAADDRGQRCAFAASGPEVDLWAPGCPMDVASPVGTAAWTSGSSESTAFVAATLVQLRQSAPGLGALQTEMVMRRAGRSSAGSVIDVGAMYVDAGLDDQLAQGRRLAPSQPSVFAGHLSEAQALPSGGGEISSPSPVAAPAEPASSTTLPLRTPLLSRMLPKPSVARLRLRNAVLSATLVNRQPGTEVKVMVYSRRRSQSLPHLKSSVRLRTNRLRIRVQTAISQIVVTYRDPAGLRSQSPPLLLHPRI
jgi:hypothetical protein